MYDMVNLTDSDTDRTTSDIGTSGYETLEFPLTIFAEKSTNQLLLFSMTLKERIIQELKSTSAANIDRMLLYMERNKYYECRSSSHNHWTGGTAQHVWAVYLIAKALRDQRMNEPNIAKYATDKKLAIVCLLHDICDMNVSVYRNDGKDISDKHGSKSYWMMKNLNVGTEVERRVVCTCTKMLITILIISKKPMNTKPCIV